MPCNGMAVSKVIGWGMIAISGRCYGKNGERYVVDFCMCELSLHRHSAYLTDIHRNDSAGFGLRVERVPVVYQRIVIDLLL
jgi:hypothetical protein